MLLEPLEPVDPLLLPPDEEETPVLLAVIDEESVELLLPLPELETCELELAEDPVVDVVVDELPVPWQTQAPKVPLLSRVCAPGLPSVQVHEVLAPGVQLLVVALELEQAATASTARAAKQSFAIDARMGRPSCPLRSGRSPHFAHAFHASRSRARSSIDVLPPVVPPTD